MTTTQTINQGTVDLVAQKRGEDTPLATRSHFCKRRGHVALLKCRILMATIPQLGPPSLCHNHPCREAAAEGIPEAMSEIPNAAPPPGAAG